MNDKDDLRLFSRVKIRKLEQRRVITGKGVEGFKFRLGLSVYVTGLFLISKNKSR